MTNKRITVYYGDGYWDVYEGWVYWMRRSYEGIAIYRILDDGKHSIIASYDDEENLRVEERIL